MSASEAIHAYLQDETVSDEVQDILFPNLFAVLFSSNISRTPLFINCVATRLHSIATMMTSPRPKKPIRVHHSSPVVALTVFLSLITLWTATAFSAEGFDSDPKALPPAVANAWNSTFIVILDRGTTLFYGTTFLTNVAVNGLQTYLYFLTARHVIDEDCSEGVICTRMRLVQVAHSIKERSPNGQIGMRFDQLSGLLLNQVSVIYSDAMADFAILRVVIDGNRKPLPPTTALSESCDMRIGEPLYAIGFPDLSARTYPPGANIEQPNSIFKRWSHGLLVNYHRVQNQANVKNAPFWIGTTIDTLPSSSGSPVFNANGQVLGLITGGATNKQNLYFGNETSGQMQVSSLALDCVTLKKYALIPTVDFARSILAHH